MKKTLFSLAAWATLIIAGCSKKDDDGSQDKMLLGKWTPESTKVKVTDIQKGGSKTTDQPVYPGDYLDFRADGKVYSYISDPSEPPGYDPRDTVPYKLTPSSLIIDMDTMAINMLNKNSLVFTFSKSDGLMFWETTFSLKK